MPLKDYEEIVNHFDAPTLVFNPPNNDLEEESIIEAKFQWNPSLMTGIEEIKIVIIILSFTFIEALANYYLSLKTDPALFKILERSSTIDKWLTLPKLFLEKYEISKESQLFEDLKLLKKRRDSIVHSKPRISINAKIAHKGNLRSLPKNFDEHQFILRYASLPKRLLDNLSIYDSSDAMGTMRIISINFYKKFKSISEITKTFMSNPKQASKK